MRAAALTFSVLLAGGAANAAPPGYFDLAPGITLETGDTWVDQAGQRYRLYAVQSCLRGTFYTDAHGAKRDCGDASLAMFAAYIKDTSPVCASVVKQDNINFVMCYATIANARLDLGNILITSGYAFASLTAKGLPLHPPYAVAEQEARIKRAGLWQFNDVQHPAVTLSQAAAKANKEPPK